MTIKQGTYTIELSSGECYDIAWSIYMDVLNSVKTHWVQHLNNDYKIEEKDKIERMERFFSMGLYRHVYVSVIEEMDKIINDAKKKRSK